MNRYKFSLTFKLKVPQVNPEDYIDALFEAGCDDAMLGIGKLGCLAVDFIREAPNAFEAVTSAIANVKQAIPDAVLIEATPDLGGISDIAELLQCSRQNIRQLIFSDLEIPPPVHEGRSPIWHMADVLSHFAATQRCTVMPEIIDLTTVNQAINTHRAFLQKQPALSKLYPNASTYLKQISTLVQTTV